MDEEEDYLEMNEETANAKEPKEGIHLVEKYEDLLKGANRKILNIVGKQGELLKRFKDSDNFFSCVGQSRSNIYFKTCLYKYSCKFPISKKSTLTSSYFKSNFKLIKKVCKANADVFTLVRKSKNICLIIFSSCLNNFF